MAQNQNLIDAIIAKNDEFYTQYTDIQQEIDAYYAYNADVFAVKTILAPCDNPDKSSFVQYFLKNFSKFRLKRFIATSYSNSDSKPGRMLIAETASSTGTGMHIACNGYLQGNGDFRTQEISNLRDTADFIITNPPFSLFGVFLSWTLAADKKFAIIGSQNAITYNKIFHMIQHNQIWLGTTQPKRFILPDDCNIESKTNITTDSDGHKAATFGNICWYTNIDHGLRHGFLPLKTAEENLASNQKLRAKLEKVYGELQSLFSIIFRYNV